MTRLKRIIKRYRLRIMRWYKTIKGPPPRVHGVIPPDPEATKVCSQEWINDMQARAYMRDLSLCLRPARPWRTLKPAAQLKPIPFYPLRHEIEPEKAGWRPVSLEVDNEY